MIAAVKRWFAGDAALRHIRKALALEPLPAVEPDAGNTLLIRAHARLMPERFAEGWRGFLAGAYPEPEALMRRRRAEGK